MKLNQMFTNVLNLTFDDLVIKVEQDSERRTISITSAMSKIDVAPTTKARLSDQEKAILKALGLSMKDVKALQGELI
jgi:hypothetical protein